MRVRFALSGPLILLLVFAVRGQEITATISGSVIDPGGATTRGASITVVNTDKGITVRP